MVKGLQRVPLLGIVMVALGCDNVEWGGIDVGLRAPSQPTIMETPAPSADTTATPADSVPLESVLYLGRRVGREAWLVPVAELHAEGLRALPGETSGQGARTFAERHFSPGSTFTLFSEGVRVGTLTATGQSPSTAYCGTRAQVTGPIELIPDAAATSTFLAVSSDLAAAVEYDDYEPVAQTRDLRVTSLNMMRGLLPTLGSPWPASVLEIRQDIQVFRSSPEAAPTVVATFVYGDSLQVGPAPGNAYSVFLVASDPDGGGYQTTYVDHRVWSRHGKGAARYFGRMDVDGDGTPELVLEVLGETSTWISVLKREDSGWSEVYQDSCGLPAPAGTGSP